MTDIPALGCQASDPETAWWVPNWPYPYGAGDGREVVRIAARKGQSGSAFYCGIESIARAEVIGVVGLTEVGRGNRKTVFSYWLGRDCRRHG